MIKKFHERYLLFQRGQVYPLNPSVMPPTCFSIGGIDNG